MTRSRSKLDELDGPGKLVGYTVRSWINDRLVSHIWRQRETAERNAGPKDTVVTLYDGESLPPRP